jgi:hypothetical protein
MRIESTNTKIIFLLLLVMFSMLNCKKDNSINPAILGRWGKYYYFNSVATKQILVFKDNGKFDAGSGGDPVTPYVDYGSYSTNGNEITIIDGNNPAGCKDVKGIYIFSIQGNQLLFELKSDACSNRSQGLPGSWTKE